MRHALITAVMLALALALIMALDAYFDAATVMPGVGT